jgi:glycosyltransferase involved in cell wall biosynthesis
MRSKPASVLLVNQYFWPDVAATAQLLSDLAEDLTTAGYRVTALAGRACYVGEGSSLSAREEHSGVAIERVWSSRLGRGSRSGRIIDYLTFFASAFVRLLLRPRVDVVVCLSTPPFVAVLGLIARLRGSRFIYKVEDLYPDVAIALGVLRRGSLTSRIFGGISRWLLSRCDAVVVLDEGMAAAVGVAKPRRVEVIPNWSDGSAIRPQPASGEAFRQRHGLAGAFVVLYSGNIGLAHRFDAVADAARLLAVEDPDLRFVFVGQGARRAQLEAQTHGLGNVLFLDYQPRVSLGDVYNAADVHLVTLQDTVSGLLWPSKYPAALAAGKPVLLVGTETSEIYREIEEGAVGWSVPHDGASIAGILLEAHADRATTLERGRRARELFESRYSRRLTSVRWLELVASLAGKCGT